MKEFAKKIEKFVNHSYEKGFFNGTWLLRMNGEIISHGAKGICHPYRNNLLNESTVFDLASVSKQFTASAVMILRDRGMLSLDDSIEMYFPELPYKGITVRNLLNHTAGLPDYMKWVGKIYADSGKIPENDIIESFLRRNGAPALFQPGDRYSYSNTGYSLLAHLVEKIGGKPFADFLKDEIFTPCGMADTCLYHRRLNGETIENYAYGMVLKNGKYVLPDETEDEGYVVPLDGINGDGAVNTTIHDMLLWDQALRRGNILSLATQNEMYTETILNNGEKCSYGYGWHVEKDEKKGKYIEHGGGWPGYNTMFTRLLEQDSMLVVLFNQTGCDAYGRMQVFKGLRELLLGGDPELPRGLEEMAAEGFDNSIFHTLSGSYDNGIEIYTENNKLMIHMSYREIDVTSELIPVGNDHFVTKMGALDIWLDGEKVKMKTLDNYVVYNRT